MARRDETRPIFDHRPSAATRPAAAALALITFLALLAAGCGGPEPLELAPHLDLAAEFPHATLGVQTRGIDFGTPAARAFLTGGWSPDQTDPKGDEPYVRSTGWSSRLWFYLVKPEEVRATLRVRALRANSPQGVELEVVLNDRPLKSLELKPKLRDYGLRLPAQRLVAGPNRLEFRYRQLDPERAARRPVLHWYRLDLGTDSEEAPAPTLDEESGVLFLPYGTEVRYLARLPRGSELRAERVRFVGEGRGRLEVRTASDPDGLVEIAKLTAAEEWSDLPLAPEGERFARLFLRAMPEGAAPVGAGVALRRPEVWSPRTPPAPAAVESRAPERRPNVIVYMIDTLRADRLGCYGHQRPVSPRIDEFAAKATLFEYVVGQSSWTRASVASLFTGLWPAAHGAVDRYDKLADEAVTLAEAMRAEGYATAAVITNFNVHRTFGFDQGFDDFIHTNRLHTASDQVNAYAKAWLEDRDPEKPFLLYLHTVDPHNPYLPPERFRQRFAPDSDDLVERIQDNTRAETWAASERTIERLLDLYDAEIAFNDESFGALADHLRELGLWEDSIVILLSDHGEQFHDHGRWTHGKDLHVETLNVPLIVKMPGQKRGQRRSEVVQHIDLMPTLLEYLGVDVSAVVQGTSFLPLLETRDKRAAPRADAYSHLRLDGPLQVSLVTDTWKLIRLNRPRGLVYHLLYRWVDDPGETTELSSERPITTEVLASLVERKLANPGVQLEGGEAELSPEVEAQLKALGYLQ